MPIFRATDHKNQVLSVLLARSRPLADAYWQGAGITPHSVQELDLLQDHPTGVIPIVNTIEVLSQEIGLKTLGSKVRILV